MARISETSIEDALVELGSNDDVDGVFISCTSLRVCGIVERAEERLGKPITSSNHALAWHALRLAGVDEQLDGLGPPLPNAAAVSGGGVEIERKYLLPGEPPARVLESATAYEIDQTYLTASSGSRRLRRRVGPDGERFWLTEKHSRGGITRSEDERELTADEYRDLLGEADPQSGTVVKTRHVIEHGTQLIEVDVFTAPAGPGAARGRAGVGGRGGRAARVGGGCRRRLGGRHVHERRDRAPARPRQRSLRASARFRAEGNSAAWQRIARWHRAGEVWRGPSRSARVAARVSRGAGVTEGARTARNAPSRR